MKKKKYLVLDCETATLPFVRNYAPKNQKKVAIARPLIYDLGYKIVDRKGQEYTRKSFLISEIFTVPEIFNTAYYRKKRPIYLNKLRKNEIQLVNWDEAAQELLEDMREVDMVGACNSMFDFKKAIPFTAKYIEKLFDDDFADWMDFQKKVCDSIVKGEKFENEEFDPDIFCFSGEIFPLFDIWRIGAEMCNTVTYKQFCRKNNLETSSGKYFPTTAETMYKYLFKRPDFIECHTAIEDADIESEILCRWARRHAVPIGIECFPFRKLGTVEEFMCKELAQKKKRR